MNISDILITSIHGNVGSGVPAGVYTLDVGVHPIPPFLLDLSAFLLPVPVSDVAVAVITEVCLAVFSLTGHCVMG